SDNVFAELDHKITIVINNREENIYTNDDFNKLISKINSFSKRDFFVNDIALRKNIDDNKYSLVYSFNSENPKFTEFSLDTYGNYIDNKTGELYQIDKTIIGAMGNHAYLDRVVLQSKDAFALSSWLFEDCESLYQVDFSKLNIKDGILPEAIFMNCKSLSNVYLTNIKRIEASAFNNCISLTEVHFSNERTKESEYGELFIPCQIKHIGKSAFKNCNKIKRIIFASNDIDIEEYAFSEMYSLQEVEFPSDFNIGKLPDAIFNNGTEINIKGNVKIDEDEKIRIGINPKKKIRNHR
ncbi:MAG: leucine-rich repeat domain-containing protein, partial [Anaeroplasmataceae bacterium]|nr:leucine-rich repeat domain-containing protein [Anaeroplasmataceae bacterium]